MIKRVFLFCTIFCLIYFSFINLIAQIHAEDAPVISNFNIDPDLDISLFSPYILNVDIANYNTDQTANLTISTLNGNIQDNDPWDYYADGTPDSSSINLNMHWSSGNTWQSDSIYPDYIYPEIYFAPSSITWYNTPLNSNVRRNNYHILHLNNPFTMTSDMNFWIELNTAAVSTINSADLNVYLVKKGKSINFFNSDWRNSNDVELVGTINRNTPFHHTHTSKSSHHLIGLSTNANGTIGTKNLDISGDFWIIVYNTSPNNNRGWNLRYHPSSLCNNTNRWYSGNFTGWTTSSQAGCPDAHIHIARRSNNKDAVYANVTAGSTTTSHTFYFNIPDNLAPNQTSFITPKAGANNGVIPIEWDPASDPNGNTIQYNLYLEDTNGSLVNTLLTDYNGTSTSLNSTSVSDGNYRLKGQACDASLCTDFYSENFSILNDPKETIFALTNISITSDYSTPSLAKPNNIVTLSFIANGIIHTPQVAMYSGGIAVTNTISVQNINNNSWEAKYTVNNNDTSGQVTFEISSTNLEARYYDTTDNTIVTIDTTTQNLNSQSTITTPVCSSEKPTSAPDLFQINVNSNSAKLYFSPINNTSEFYISYSEKIFEDQHGAQVNLSKEGVLNYTVDHLKKNTIYYFKVRGQNECMPGEWSNIMKIKTNLNKNSTQKTYYKYTKGNTMISYINSTIHSLPLMKKNINTQKQKKPNKLISNQTNKKENCILWWCF